MSDSLRPRRCAFRFHRWTKWESTTIIVTKLKTGVQTREAGQKRHCVHCDLEQVR